MIHEVHNESDLKLNDWNKFDKQITQTAVFCLFICLVGCPASWRENMQDGAGGGILGILDLGGILGE